LSYINNKRLQSKNSILERFIIILTNEKRMKLIKICIIDTFVNLDHNCFTKGNNKNAIKIIETEEKMHIQINNHGTAVASIIYNNSDNVEITVFPVFNTIDDSIELNELISVLKTIDLNYDFDIINLSNGIVMSDDFEELKLICEKITQKGTIIISAYDNSGLMTYPACLDCVIGIDISDRFHSIDQFEFIEGSRINIVGTNMPIRIPWENNTYIFLGGASFITAYITSIISKALYEGENIYTYLKKKACKSTVCKGTMSSVPSFNIKSAVIFPLNKEMHALVKFLDILPFDIAEYFDLKYSPNIGKKVSEIVYDSNSDNIVKCIDYINWDNNFDTIIIGHLNKIMNFLGKESIEEIVTNCINHNKKLYCYDNFIYENFCDHSIIKYNDNIFFPQVTKDNIPFINNKKLWAINKPVICIMGTSSKQGKYTLLLTINKYFQDYGYKTGMISTEPNGWLLNANAVFPYGYLNTIYVNEIESIQYLNEMLHNIENNDKVDLILSSAQSGTIPYSNLIYNNISVEQLSFLYALNPDGVVLCVSPHDEIDYIKRTIRFIEAAGNTKVISIAIYPIIQEEFCGGLYKGNNLSGTDILKKLIIELRRELNIDIVVENNFDGAVRISKSIIEFLS
jgi:uncharacterized protein YhbP (UPF0306 family)